MIGKNTLNELGAIVSTPHLKMKFHTLTREIVIVKVDQKQARQCYNKSLKVASHSPIRELGKPHSSFDGSNSQVMSVNEDLSIKTLTVYEIARVT